MFQATLIVTVTTRTFGFIRKPNYTYTLLANHIRPYESFDQPVSMAAVIRTFSFLADIFENFLRQEL